MERITLLVLVLTGIYGLLLTREALQAGRDRKKLEHVIYVNGTRGKSTVTRLIDAGLRAGGFRVLSKSTGTLPMCIHTDGRESEIERRGPANIREQLTFLHQAAEEGAQILVIECMALDPGLQRVSSRRMLRADIGVITNARLDHMDVMGDTREEILNCLMEMLPVKGQIFTAEKELFPQLEQRAELLDSSLTLARAEEAADCAELDFPENIALALAVCGALGVERETALAGMRNFIRDPFALSVYEKGSFTFVNALSANDVTSTELIYEEQRKEGQRLEILINNRGDRPARALDMVRLCSELKPARILLLGDRQEALKRLCEKKVAPCEILCCASAEAVPFEETVPTLLLATGNIKNEGIRLSDRVRRELTAVPIHGKE